MLYMKLFHGRMSPAEELDDWGFDGPVFGPLSFVHTTYANSIHLGSPDSPHDTVGDLSVHGDLLYYDGMYYGDWSVFDETFMNADMRRRHQPFDEAKARVL